MANELIALMVMLLVAFPFGIGIFFGLKWWKSELESFMAVQWLILSVFFMQLGLVLLIILS